MKRRLGRRELGDLFVLAITIASLIRTAAGQPQAMSASVSGTVVDKMTAQPIEGVEVRAAGSGAVAQAMTGADGTYALRGLTPGNYMILSSRAGYAASARKVRVNAGEQASGVDVQLPKESVIAGRILNTDKLPVSGARG